MRSSGEFRPTLGMDPNTNFLSFIFFSTKHDLTSNFSPLSCFLYCSIPLFLVLERGGGMRVVSDEWERPDAGDLERSH
jgi:hypothetical protein